jgi:hypothetical protein
MSITNNNIFILLCLAVLFIYILNFFMEKFKIIVCPPGQIERSNGKCGCPLVGQIYDTNKKICKCDYNKKKKIFDNRTICI